MRVVVVGATDGIGRALAAEYLVRGWRVGVVGRDPAKLDDVLDSLRADTPEGIVEGVVCDVTDPDANDRAFDEVLRVLGQIDLLVYCAGVMPDGDDTGARIAGAAPMLDVNVRGAVHWLERGADYMAAAGRGRLAAVGSIAGERGRSGAPVYGATKAALHAYLEGLRNRLHGTGVGVSAVKPGWVRTRMLDEATSASPAAISTDKAARIIADRLDRGRDAFFVPGWWALVSLGLRLTPRFLYKRFAPP